MMRPPSITITPNGVLSANGSHLANLALRRGQVVRWADVKV